MFAVCYDLVSNSAPFMKPRFFGQYLLANGLINAPQLLAAVEYQERNNPRLGELALSMGLATQFEVDQIQALQATHDLRFGEAAQRLGLLECAEVARVLAAQSDRHVLLGHALAALGYLTPTEVEAAAAEFLTKEAQLEPESATIPEDLPLRRVAFELFHLAHKLLLRVCELPSKTERLRVVTDVVPLSDRNVLVTLRGALDPETPAATDTGVLLCVPQQIAVDLATRFSGEIAPAETAVNDVVCELAGILCNNLRSVLAEQGARVEIGEPEVIPSRLSLPPGRRMAVVPFVTHSGLVMVCLALPRGDSGSSAPPAGA
jgi:hypothetical protein